MLSSSWPPMRKMKIEENRKWQQEMSSWSEDYVVVLNKTWTDLALKLTVINSITQWVVQFIEETHMILTLQQEIHQLERIDQWGNYILQDLDYGKLTELLLAQEVFDTFEHKLGEYWPAVDWYYHWSIIVPLWNEGWVFKTHLLVVSQCTVLGYELEAFLIWDTGNLTVKLDIACYVALNTSRRIIW